MPALAALITLAAAAQASTPAPLFAAFKAACHDVQQFDRVGAAASAAGWTPVAEQDADPRIAAIVAKGRDAMRKEEPDAKIAGQLFRHKFDGRDVWLATSRVEFKIDGKAMWGNGCRAYDLDAPSAVPARTLTGWVGQPPTGVQGNAGAVKTLWEPWHPGVTLEITYVPRDNPLGAQFGIQGLILVSQAMGGF
jgi:hypothetical protein